MNFGSYRLDWRLTLLLLFILLSILYTLFLLIVPSQNQTNKAEPIITPTPSQSSLNPSSMTIPTTAMIPLTTNSFNIYYPKEWKATNGKSALGEITTFQPPSLPFGVSKPILMIETRYESSTIDKVIEFYTKQNFQRTRTTIDGFTTTKISGTNPYKIVSGKPIQSSIQEIYLLLNKGATEYIIRYSYDGDKSNPDFEEIFTSIINTMRFTK